MQSRNLIAAVSFLAFAIVPLADSFATQPTRLLWKARGVENVVSIAWIDDIDGDARPDLLFESYDAGPSGVDHLFAISGASSDVGDIIWSARPLGGPSNSGGYGEYCLQVWPDMTGDGRSDILYGSAWGGRSAYILDGPTGQTIWSFDTYVDSPPSPPVSGWVYAATSLGSDLNGDAVNEVLFCAGSENNGLYCADGATGAILWFHRGEDAFDHVASIADIDNDGVRDVAACQTDNYPKIKVFSGRPGVGGVPVLRWSASLGNAIWNSCELPRNGEPNTLVAGCWDGTIRGYNAATGALRWTGAVGDPVQRVVPIPDVNGDGMMDLAVGSWDNAGRVHSGADGSLIWRTPVGTVNGGDCWTCDSVGDTNGDGVADVAFGSFDLNAYLMDGRSGAILWSYFVNDRVLSIRGVPDVTGNGIPEVAVGTQLQYGAAHGGDCWLLEGNDGVPPAAAADAAGMISALSVEPNPARDLSRWTIALTRPSAAGRLEILDSSGRRIRTLQLGPLPSGVTRVTWDGRGDDGNPIAAGVYLGRLVAEGRGPEVRRIVRLR